MKKGGSRSFALRNAIAKDLHTDKYAQRIKPSKRRRLVDYVHRREADEEVDKCRRFGYTDDEEG